jgi:hypothetical protein
MEIFSLPSFWPEGLLLPLLCIWPLHKPLGHSASSPGSPAAALSSLLGPAPLFLFGPKLASPAPLVRAPRNGPAQLTRPHALCSSSHSVPMTAWSRIFSHCHMGPACKRCLPSLARNRGGHAGGVRCHPVYFLA